VSERLFVQPVAVESRYMCRVHQRNHQSSKSGHPASAPRRYHHDDKTPLERQLSKDVDDETTSGRRCEMTSSSGRVDEGGEAITEEGMTQENGREEFDAAAATVDYDDDDDDDEPVWIKRSPRNSTSDDISWRRERHLPDVHPQYAPEVFRPDDDDDVRRRKRRRTRKDETVSGCHRARALFVRKRAIVEWRAMSAVIDRLLFCIFLAATTIVYFVIFIVVPMTNSKATPAT